VLATVHLSTVGRAPHLGGHLVQGEVQGCHLVLGRGLGADDRSPGLRGQLDTYGPLRIPRSRLPLDEHVDPDDPVVVLLQPSELLLDVIAKALRHLAVATADHNIHG
jgi:hypothetical protein